MHRSTAVEPKRFLSAEWRWLAMLNYEVSPQILRPLVPAGVELDTYRGRTYVSVVGFLFLHTRVLGLPIPFHRHFEEINLRFYVRREVDGELRRGVVFVKELVPRWAIAAVARWAYNEAYEAVPMRHHLIGLPDPRIAPDGPLETDPARRSVSYDWRMGSRWCRVALEGTDELQPLAADSEPQFITEHYWGYCRQRDGGTVEYRVEHPSWHVCNARSSLLDCDIAQQYGREFVEPLSGPPASAFLAAGSPISVFRPVRM